MKLTVSGDAEFRAFQLSCHKAADNLERRMDRGLMRAGEDVGRAVHVGTDIYMPSGFEDLFRNRLQTKVEPERARRGVVVVAWARGRTGKSRDVVRMNKGILKHPVFGRERTLKSGLKQRNPWATTAIRPRFFDDPFTFAAPKAVEGRLGQALEEVLEEAAS